MPTTSNFGWTTPADTDLVKDGAAAIRTLGNGIDTSFVDLKGGTTGQVLSKASNTDLDFTWIAADPLTILDAKGDLISATAADTPARLAVGTNGQVLTADSTTATGLKWATPAAGGFTLIASGSLSGTTVTLSSIPTTYRRLHLEMNGVSQSNDDQVYLRVNNLTGGNYFYVADNCSNLNQQSTGATSFTFNGQNTINSNTSAAYIAEFHNPSSTTGWKLVDMRGAWLISTGVSNQASRLSGAVETLSAITRLDIIAAGSGTFDSGTYALYGVN